MLNVLFADTFLRHAESQPFKTIDGQKPLGMMHVVTEKTDPIDGSFLLLKDRLVVLGNNQIEGEHYDAKKAPVVTQETVRLMDIEATIHDWDIHKYDVKGAFCQAEKLTTLIVRPAPGFTGQTRGELWRLLKELYGTVEAALMWYRCFGGFVETLDLVTNAADPCLFQAFRTVDNAQLSIYVYIHVDDFLVTGSDTAKIQWFQTKVCDRFPVKILDYTSHLGIRKHRIRNADPTKREMLLDLKPYLEAAAKAFGVDSMNDVPTPMDTGFIVSKEDPSDTEEGSPNAPYREIVGKIAYATAVLPGAEFAVNVVCRYGSNWKHKHWMLAKRCLRWMYQNRARPLRLCNHEPEHALGRLVVFIDSDHGGDKDRSRSTTCYRVLWRKNLLHNKVRIHKMTTLTTCESEWVAVAEAAKKLIWILELLRSARIEMREIPIFYCDNSAVCLAVKNYFMSDSNRHIRMRYWFIRDLEVSQMIRIRKIATGQNVADIGTKALDKDTFNRHNDVQMGYGPWPKNENQEEDVISAHPNGLTER